MDRIKRSVNSQNEKHPNTEEKISSKSIQKIKFLPPTKMLYFMLQKWMQNVSVFFSCLSFSCMVMIRPLCVVYLLWCAPWLAFYEYILCVYCINKRELTHLYNNLWDIYECLTILPVPRINEIGFCMRDRRGMRIRYGKSFSR